ncbi:MAG: HAD-IA family hydrolase [Bacteroidales bacterium]|nr:HAD-IA family hydrolase [Candidatus Cacconaster scatequi]
MFILSNNNPVCLKHEMEILDKQGVSGCFREFFFSFRLKMLKPGREIFDEVVRRTGFLPEEILFVDDSIANVEGARAAGLNAVRYKKGDDILAKYNLSLS